jgi:hypothetical protein
VPPAGQCRFGEATLDRTTALPVKGGDGVYWIVVDLP